MIGKPQQRVKRVAERGGAGAQHLAYWTDDGFDDAERRLGESGYLEGHSGRMGMRGRFAYVVHPDMRSGMFDISEMAGGKGDCFREIRRTAAASNGVDPIRRIGAHKAG